MLARPVVRPGEAALDQPLVDGVERLVDADDGARGQHLEGHGAVGQRLHVLGELLEHADLVRSLGDHRLDADLDRLVLGERRRDRRYRRQSARAARLPMSHLAMGMYVSSNGADSTLDVVVGQPLTLRGRIKVSGIATLLVAPPRGNNNCAQSLERGRTVDRLDFASGARCWPMATVAAGAAAQAAIGMGLNLFAVPLLALIDPVFVPGPVLFALLPAVGDRRAIGCARTSMCASSASPSVACWRGPSVAAVGAFAARPRRACRGCSAGWCWWRSPSRRPACGSRSPLRGSIVVASTVAGVMGTDCRRARATHRPALSAREPGPHPQRAAAVLHLRQWPCADCAAVIGMFGWRELMASVDTPAGPRGRVRGVAVAHSRDEPGRHSRLYPRHIGRSSGIGAR